MGQECRRTSNQREETATPAPATEPAPVKACVQETQTPNLGTQKNITGRSARVHLGPTSLTIPALLLLAGAATIKVNYLLFHTLTELFAITVGLMIGVVGWYSFRFSRNHMLAFLASAYPCIAAIDLFHTLAYKGMGVFPADANLPTQLWIAARGIEAAALLIAPTFLHSELRPGRAIIGFATLTALLLGLIAGGLFPDMYQEGSGLTPIKIGSEHLIIVMLAVAGFRLWRQRDRMDSDVLKLIAIALGLTMLSELLFTFYIEVYDLSNMFGHLAKLASFWLVFFALAHTSLAEPFHMLSRGSSTYDAIPDEISVVDAKGRIRQINRVIEQRHKDISLGESCHDRFHPKIPQAECPACLAVAEGRIENTIDLHYPEEARWRELTLSPIHHRRRPHGVVHVLRDVTGRKLAEEELKRLNRAMRAITASNQTLIHARDEETLLQDVCNIVVEKGGYRMAWVGYPSEEPGRPLVVKAWAGSGAAYLSTVPFSWGDNRPGRRPTGMAVRNGEIRISNDIANDADFGEARDAALGFGFKAMTAFPLLAGNHRPSGMLAIYSGEANVFSDEEVAILSELAGDLGYGIHALRADSARTSAEARALEWEQRLAGTLEQTVQALAGMVELRDPYTAGHQRRVAELAAAIGREMGLDERRLEGLFVIGLVHDVGKIQVPAEILSRPRQLTQIEFDLVRGHSDAGHEILREVSFPWPVADAVHQHHERLDGSGYPQGLSGDQVLLEARIIGIADVVEAMASFRPYREALGVERALNEIEDQSGILYDPDAVAACVKLFRVRGFAWGQPTIVEKKRETPI